MMETKFAKRLEAGPEQLLYADFLQKGMLIGLCLVLLTYIIYVAGIIQPYIPLSDIPKYWSVSVHEYLKVAHVPTGWAWATMLNKSDFLNFVGIAILAGVSIFCYLAIIPTLWKNGDKIYTIFAILEVLILVFAASGILAVGGH